MSNSYNRFIRMFCNLSPYDLKHFSECFLCKIEGGFEEKLCGCNSKIELTQKDIKFALTETMQDVMLELKQREIVIENLKLDQTKALIFADRKITA